RTRLALAAAYFCAPFVLPLLAQQQPPTQQPQTQQPQGQQPAQQNPQPPRNPNNPFETVPQAAPQQPAQPAPQPQQPAQPGQPRLETPQQPEARVQPSGEIIESIEFRGVRRVPQDTLKALIVSKPGDVYNEESVRHDLTILWNTQRFD